mgnify:CR=1 FL=1
MSSLRFIKEVEITSSVSSIDITNVFSEDFDIYKIVTSNIQTAGSASTSAVLRVINSSGSVITSNYQYAGLSMTDAYAFVEEKSTADTKIKEFFGVGYQSPSSSGSVSYCLNPYQNNRYTFFINQSSSGSLRYKKQIALVPNFSSVTGFQVKADTVARPYDSGLIRVYGLNREDS